jgi:8-oxo-dGTP diphosphatase
MTSLKPNVAVRAVIVKDNKILLVNGDSHKDFWCAPGGRTEFGEDLKTAVRREVKEETGLDVLVGHAFAVSEFLFETNNFHNIDVFFHCEISGGALSEDWVDSGGPVTERRFFTLDELQNINVFPRHLREGEWLKPSTANIYRGQDKKD